MHNINRFPHFCNKSQMSITKSKNGFADYPGIPRTGSHEPERTPRIPSLIMQLMLSASSVAAPRRSFLFGEKSTSNDSIFLVLEINSTSSSNSGKDLFLFFRNNQNVSKFFLVSLAIFLVPRPVIFINNP